MTPEEGPLRYKNPHRRVLSVQRDTACEHYDFS